MLFMSCVCHAFAYVHCCLVATCWERADLSAIVCDVKLINLVSYISCSGKDIVFFFRISRITLHTTCTCTSVRSMRLQFKIVGTVLQSFSVVYAC